MFRLGHLEFRLQRGINHKDVGDKGIADTVRIRIHVKLTYIWDTF